MLERYYANPKSCVPGDSADPASAVLVMIAEHKKRAVVRPIASGGMAETTRANAKFMVDSLRKSLRWRRRSGVTDPRDPLADFAKRFAGHDRAR